MQFSPKSNYTLETDDMYPSSQRHEQMLHFSHCGIKGFQSDIVALDAVRAGGGGGGTTLLPWSCVASAAAFSTVAAASSNSNLADDNASGLAGLSGFTAASLGV